MYRVKGFEYDLIKKDGKNLVRTIETGEIAEVSDEVMRFFEAEKKKIMRVNELVDDIDSEDIDKRTKAMVLFPVSYDSFDEKENNDGEEKDDSSWLCDDYCLEDDIEVEDVERRFVELLTKNQKNIFYSVMKNGESQIEYSARNGISDANVRKIINKIRKKYKNF